MQCAPSEKEFPDIYDLLQELPGDTGAQSVLYLLCAERCEIGREFLMFAHRIRSRRLTESRCNIIRALEYHTLILFSYRNHYEIQVYTFFSLVTSKHR